MAGEVGTPYRPQQVKGRKPAWAVHLAALWRLPSWGRAKECGMQATAKLVTLATVCYGLGGGAALAQPTGPGPG